MEDLKNWLQSPERDYTEGVMLYGKYGKNRKLMANLQYKDSELNREKLHYELGKIADLEAVEMVALSPESVTKTPNIEPEPTVKFDIKRALEKNIKVQAVGDTPSVLVDLIVKRQHLTNKKAIIHNEMVALSPEAVAERKDMMAQMAAIRSEIEAITDAENVWKATGEMPTPNAEQVSKKNDLNAPIPTDKVELLALKKSLSERRSKLNAKLKNMPQNLPESVLIIDKIAKIDVKQKEIATRIQQG